MYSLPLDSAGSAIFIMRCSLEILVKITGGTGRLNRQVAVH